MAREKRVAMPKINSLMVFGTWAVLVIAGELESQAGENAYSFKIEQIKAQRVLSV